MIYIFKLQLGQISITVYVYFINSADYGLWFHNP